MSNDILNTFKNTLDHYPKDASDFNIICTVAYAEYTVCTTLLEALLLPQGMMKRGLNTALTALNAQAYHDIIHALNGLNTVLQTASPFIPPRIDPDICRVANLLFTHCKDLLSAMPESMFNLFEDFNNGIKSFIDLNNDLIALPSDAANMVAKSLLKLKTQALKDLTGVLFDTVLSPIMAYEDFLIDNNILAMIAKMKKIENCMTNKSLCNRPRADFIHPTGKILNSSYYRNQMMINSQGKVDIKYAGETSEQKTQFNNVMKSLRTFRGH